MAAVEFLTILFLSFSFDIVHGVEFLEKPQNLTIDSSWTQFTLMCRIDVATHNGMDWTAEKIVVCWSIDSEVFKCAAGYSVERPNNRTMNLVMQAVHFQNSSVAGNYCCYGDDGQGTPAPACSYVTVTDVSQSPQTDITKANGVTITKANGVTATVNIATSTYLSTTPSALASGAIAGIVIGGLVFIILVILLICIFCRGCPIYNRRHKSSGLGNEGTPAENKEMVPK